MPKSQKRKQAIAKDGRPTLYNKRFVSVLEGSRALTADRAKELLGWEEVQGTSYHFRDVLGNKIDCTNNPKNRPIAPGNLTMLKQEILRKRWHLNLENRIIGRTGLVLNGQHTLIALVLAVQEWQLRQEIWGRYWKTEPTIETSIAFGASEKDEVVNTLDTGKRRDLADVIYRSPYFATLPPKNRKHVSRITNHAVTMLWHRTGVKNAFQIRRTHSEALNFIERHQRVLECVKHIFAEDGNNGKIKGVLGPGYASALLYLMGASATDPRDYRHSDNPCEKLLTWDNWDQACDFWALLAGNRGDLTPVREMLSEMLDASDSGKISADRRCAIVVKAWLAWIAGRAITQQTLQLDYVQIESGARVLASLPSTGGIDLGDPDGIETDANDGPALNDPTPEEIEERSAKVRVQAAPRRGKTVSSLLGKTVWVAGDSDGETWRGTVVRDSGKTVRVRVGQGFRGTGTTRAVSRKRLRRH